jgi:hypothetical protein
LLHDYSPRRFAARPANGRRRALHRDAVGSDQPPARRRCCEGVSETNLHHVLNATFVCVALICGEYQVADRPEWSAIPSAKVSYKRRKVYAAITAIGGANQMSKKTKEVRKAAKKSKRQQRRPEGRQRGRGDQVRRECAKWSPCSPGDGFCVHVQLGHERVVRGLQLLPIVADSEGRPLQFYSISSVIIRGSPVTILGFIDRFTSIDLPISMSYLYSRRSQ